MKNIGDISKILSKQLAFMTLFTEKFYGFLKARNLLRK